jgi:uncharacterized DUF497 family protein
MSFEWDIKKNKTNIEKHGLSFEEASHIFDRDVLISVKNSLKDV